MTTEPPHDSFQSNCISGNIGGSVVAIKSQIAVKIPMITCDLYNQSDVDTDGEIFSGHGEQMSLKDSNLSKELYSHYVSPHLWEKVLHKIQAHG